MNIINKTPITMEEAKEYAKNVDSEKPIHAYFKKFAKLGKEKAKKIYEEVKALDNPKIKDENIIKIADLLPETAEDLNKIFVEVALSEEEIKSLLDIVSKHSK